MDLLALVDHIVATHHAYLRTHFPRISAGLNEIEAPPELMRPWRELRATMDQHMHKEEFILFPAIRSLAQGADEPWIVGPVAVMEAEHEEIRALEHTLRQEAHRAGRFRADVIALLDDLAEHARKEDEELFTEVRRRLQVDAHP